MALRHPSLGLVSSILLGVSTLFLFFVILGGVTHRTPLKHTYFLQADTSGMTGARDVSQWTYFYVCGHDNRDCSSAHAAMPFGKAWHGHASNVPSKLIGKYGGHTTSKYYYYMWRFGWVFYIMALFFTVCAFFSSFLACCGRLGAGIGSLVTMLALFFLTLAVSLMTAVFTRARNVFHDNNRSAKLGKYAFGFSWGAWTALFLAMLLLCAGLGKSRKDRNSNNYANNNNNNNNIDNENINNGNYVNDAPPPEKKSRRRWGRRGRSQRSRSRGGLPENNFQKSTYDENRMSAVSGATPSSQYQY